MIKDWVLKICMIDFVDVKRITCMHKCDQGRACFCELSFGTDDLSTKEKIQKDSKTSRTVVSLHLLSIETVLSSETAWLRENYSWLSPMQIFYHSVVCTKPGKCRSCQFPSSSASPLTDNAVVSMSGFWGIYQKCCKIYLWNNLPTGKVLPYQFHWACAFMYPLIFTVLTLAVLIIRIHVRCCHWQRYLVRPHRKIVRWTRRQKKIFRISADV